MIAAVNIPDISTALGLTALIVALGGSVVMSWVWRTTTPRRIAAGPATMEVRDENPALVDLLTGGFEVEDDAVPATVVDLAHRGWFTIEDYGDDTIIRTRERRPAADQLTPYDERVLRHIERHAVDGTVPTKVLTIGSEGVSERWFDGFVGEVTAHGQALGLCRRRWDVKHVVVAWVLFIVSIATTWIIANAAPTTTDPNGWGTLGNLFTGLAGLAGLTMFWFATKVSRAHAQTETPAGREVAAHWLGVRDYYRNTGDFEDKPAASVAIWDRHLAYATAMGLAPVVQRQIPFETEHDKRAWSRETGDWRRVKVRYRSFMPGWGRHPGRVAFEGLIQGAVVGALAVGGFVVARRDTDLDTLTAQQRQWLGLAGLIVSIAAVAIFVVVAAKLVIGLADLFRRRTVEGELVRQREFRAGHSLPKPLQWIAFSGRDQSGMSRRQQRKIKRHLAIDDGSDETILAYEVASKLYGRAPQGARVRVKVSPWLGYVSELTVLAPPRPSAASERARLHPLAEQAVAEAGAKVSGSIGALIANAEDLTDDDGRPLLDQTDDDGVALRDRLAESQDQLAQLRNDPRFENSPVAEMLDAFSSDQPDRAE